MSANERSIKNVRTKNDGGKMKFIIFLYFFVMQQI